MLSSWSKDTKAAYTFAAVVVFFFSTNALVEVLRENVKHICEKLGVISDLTRDS